MEEIKKIIKDNYNDAPCGLFFTRNKAGDEMETLYNDGQIQLDICYTWAYFEVFGLTYEERLEIYNFYDALGY